MKYISIDEVVAIHFELVRQFGGTQGIRDFGLLHASVERPKATFGGKDLYPNIYRKAAALLHSLVLNHAFLDGNKRTGYVSTARMLGMNGCVFQSSKTLIIQFILKIEKEKLSIDKIANWIEKNTKVI